MSSTLTVQPPSRDLASLLSSVGLDSYELAFLDEGFDVGWLQEQPHNALVEIGTSLGLSCSEACLLADRLVHPSTPSNRTETHRPATCEKAGDCRYRISTDLLPHVVAMAPGTHFEVTRLQRCPHLTLIPTPRLTLISTRSLTYMPTPTLTLTQTLPFSR